MPENWIRLTETVYSGGTVVASEGQEISPEQAYALGVNDDGTLDRTLSTDQLRERALSLAAPAEEPPAEAGDAPADDQATVTGDGSSQALPAHDPESPGPHEAPAVTEPPVPAEPPPAPATKTTRARKL